MITKYKISEEPERVWAHYPLRPDSTAEII